MPTEARAAWPRFVSENGTNAMLFDNPVDVAGDLVIMIEASDDLTNQEEISSSPRCGPWTGTPDVTGTESDQESFYQLTVHVCEPEIAALITKS
jgi:hypothetical protein